MRFMWLRLKSSVCFTGTEEPDEQRAIDIKTVRTDRKGWSCRESMGDNSERQNEGLHCWQHLKQWTGVCLTV